MASQFHLLKTKRFLPIFITQFLGAFNDNIFKNALVVFITYHLAQKAGLNAQVLVTVAAGIFILPFFLFSVTAGQLADKHEKSHLIRRIKRVEIILMLCAAIGFYLEDVWLLLAILFAMGTQSAFFGPLKYSILPSHLKAQELIAGNGLVEAATFLAILLGTIVGGLLILSQNGIITISLLIIVVAISGLTSSYYIPFSKPASSKLTIGWNIPKETWQIIRHAYSNRKIFPAILGISWFWLVGATFLSQFPTYTKNVIGGNEEIITLFLTTFSIGIGIGSLLCNRLLKGRVKANYVPLGCLGISIFAIDLYFASQGIRPVTDTYIGFADYLSGPPAYFRILLDFMMIAVSGGIYIVPLYAIVQTHSNRAHLARNIASNNVLNALFMVASALAIIGLYSAGFTVNDVFLTLALANGGVFFLVRKFLR